MNCPFESSHMPWPVIHLNDGAKMPSAAYGHNYWTGNDQIVGDVVTAIESGFHHLDTAQGYYDEDKFAQAIKEAGLSRNDYYLTTKWSRADTDIVEACENSLTQLAVDQVDLYLIHARQLCGNDISGRWRDMENVKKLGYARSIGVSNFELHVLKTLVSGANVIPAVLQNQIDPHSYAESLPLFQYCKEHGIVLAAFSPLWPLRTDPSGPVAHVTAEIASKLGAAPEQVLLAWCKSKGAAVVTSSSKRSRMEGYISAGDIDLSPKEIKLIDEAGWESTMFERRSALRQRAVKSLLWILFLLMCIWGACALVLRTIPRESYQGERNP